MDKELYNQFLALNKSLAIQVQAQAFLLYAVIHSLDDSSLQLINSHLESHAANYEYEEITVDALHVAQKTFALLCDNADPRALFHLIQGGKKDG